jgi:hypothetical protein
VRARNRAFQALSQGLTGTTREALENLLTFTTCICSPGSVSKRIAGVCSRRYAALEDAGILTSVHRLTKIRRRSQDLFGAWASVWQVNRTSRSNLPALLDRLEYVRELARSALLASDGLWFDTARAFARSRGRRGAPAIPRTLATRRSGTAVTPDRNSRGSGFYNLGSEVPLAPAGQSQVRWRDRCRHHRR